MKYTIFLIWILLFFSFGCKRITDPEITKPPLLVGKETNYVQITQSNSQNLIWIDKGWVKFVSIDLDNNGQEDIQIIDGFEGTLSGFRFYKQQIKSINPTILFTTQNLVDSNLFCWHRLSDTSSIYFEYNHPQLHPCDSPNRDQFKSLNVLNITKVWNKNDLWPNSELFQFQDKITINSRENHSLNGWSNYPESIITERGFCNSNPIAEQYILFKMISQNTQKRGWICLSNKNEITIHHWAIEI